MVISRIIGSSVKKIKRIYGGKNSQAFETENSTGERYFVKKYYSNVSDKRNRLVSEFSSLRYLKKYGISSIPEPIGIDYDNKIAVYEFVEGCKTDKPTDDQIRLAADFLIGLNGLRFESDAKELNRASDAWLCLQDGISDITNRLRRFQSINKQTRLADRLQRVIDEQYNPLAERIINYVSDEYIRKGWKIDEILPISEQTLSPSDFGFHNALISNNGAKIVFLDFEYFGWDDPAKMIADFMFHPGMNLSVGQQNIFKNRMLEKLNSGTSLKERLPHIYQISGLKWVMIVLNEFIREDRYRREFVSNSKDSIDTIQEQQLDKAVNLIERIKSEFEC